MSFKLLFISLSYCLFIFPYITSGHRVYYNNQQQQQQQQQQQFSRLHKLGLRNAAPAADGNQQEAGGGQQLYLESMEDLEHVAHLSMRNFNLTDESLLQSSWLLSSLGNALVHKQHQKQQQQQQQEAAQQQQQPGEPLATFVSMAGDVQARSRLEQMLESFIWHLRNGHLRRLRLEELAAISDSLNQSSSFTWPQDASRPVDSIGNYSHDTNNQTAPKAEQEEEPSVVPDRCHYLVAIYKHELEAERQRIEQLAKQQRESKLEIEGSVAGLVDSAPTQMDGARLMRLCRLATKCHSAEELVALISGPWLSAQLRAQEQQQEVVATETPAVESLESVSDGHQRVKRKAEKPPTGSGKIRLLEPTFAGGGNRTSSSVEYSGMIQPLKTRTSLRDSLSLSLAKLCPLILFQLHDDDGLCSVRRDDRPPMMRVWGFATLFVTIVSFCSLIGLSITPLLGPATRHSATGGDSSGSDELSGGHFYCPRKEQLPAPSGSSGQSQYQPQEHRACLTLFEGLAVGSLVGSALFSLIPQAFELQERESNQGFLLKALIIFFGIYLFFCSERLMRIILDTRQQRKKRKRLQHRSSNSIPLPSTTTADILFEHHFGSGQQSHESSRLSSRRHQNKRLSPGHNNNEGVQFDTNLQQHKNQPNLRTSSKATGANLKKEGGKLQTGDQHIKSSCQQQPQVAAQRSVNFKNRSCDKDDGARDEEAKREVAACACGGQRHLRCAVDRGISKLSGSNSAPLRRGKLASKRLSLVAASNKQDNDCCSIEDSNVGLQLGDNLAANAEPLKSSGRRTTGARRRKTREQLSAAKRRLRRRRRRQVESSLLRNAHRRQNSDDLDLESDETKALAKSRAGLKSSFTSHTIDGRTRGTSSSSSSSPVSSTTFTPTAATSGSKLPAQMSRWRQRVDCAAESEDEAERPYGNYSSDQSDRETSSYDDYDKQCEALQQMIYGGGSGKSQRESVQMNRKLTGSKWSDGQKATELPNLRPSDLATRRRHHRHQEELEHEHTNQRQLASLQCNEGVEDQQEDKAPVAQHHRGHSHHHQHATIEQDISTVAWMIVLGDGLHNFIDGISIGAAFSESILSGVSISVAVICEEFPHELGDFAVLVSSGMTVRQALGYNFLSACTCYLGMAVGIILGDVNDGASYISALAAGVFLYIALVDMMGELSATLEETSRDSITKTLKLLFLQNVGIFIGISIIFILSFIDF